MGNSGARGRPLRGRLELGQRSQRRRKVLQIGGHKSGYTTTIHVGSTGMQDGRARNPRRHTLVLVQVGSLYIFAYII